MKEEHKTSKALKGQLLGAISMMLVAAIALGTSTYAWFINNQATEVQNMQLTVSTSTSMLVAVGKKDSIATPTADANWTGYKSIVINQDITGVAPGGAAATGDVADWNAGTGSLAKNMLTVPITPASISNRALMATATGAAPALKFFATDNHVTKGLLDQFVETAIGTDVLNVGMGPVKRIPLKFSSSENVDVYFGKSGLNGIADMISPAIKVGDAKPGGGKYDATADAAVIAASLEQANAVKRALRVAIVPQKADGYTADVKPVVFQFDAGTKIDTNGNNTDYQYVTAVTNIFPNADNDTAATGDRAAALAGIQSATTGKYAAIKAIDGTKHITDIAIQQAELPASTKTWAAVDMTTGTAVVTAPADGTPIFQLVKGKARPVDVYIWMEGTDEDCLNSLSNHTFNLNIPFASTPTVVVP